MQPLRIGVLGAARITGRAMVAPAAATGDRLVAVAARDRDRATAFADRHGVESVLDSYDAVINAPDVELPIGVDDAVDTAEMIDDVYRAAGFEPRPSQSPARAPR